MRDVILCLILAAICFAMFFGFGPTPDNQMVAVMGMVCLFCAGICYSNYRSTLPRA